MIKKTMMIIVYSILLIVLGGCSVGASTDDSEYTAKDLQRYARVEVYSAADNTLLNTIEDKETLIWFANNNAFAEQVADIDADEYLNRQEENKKTLDGYESLYIIVSYKTPAAANNNGALEKISEMTLYKDTNMIMEQVSPDVIKSFKIPSEYMTAYYEISDEDMSFLASLTGETGL